MIPPDIRPRHPSFQRRSDSPRSELAIVMEEQCAVLGDKGGFSVELLQVRKSSLKTALTVRARTTCLTRNVRIRSV